MATQDTTTATDDSNFAEQRRTYDAFMKTTKWSVIGLAIVVVLLYFVINP